MHIYEIRCTTHKQTHTVSLCSKHTRGQPKANICNDCMQQESHLILCPEARQRARTCDDGCKVAFKACNTSHSAAVTLGSRMQVSSCKNTGRLQTNLENANKMNWMLAHDDNTLLQVPIRMHHNYAQFIPCKCHQSIEHFCAA
jgi:hypothetical protein